MKGLAIILLALAAGCASAPNKAPVASSGSTRPSQAGDQAAGYALTMVGKPYRYGGSSPKGFDCSGLVLYSYKNAGVALPHRAIGRPCFSALSADRRVPGLASADRRRPVR